VVSCDEVYGYYMLFLLHSLAWFFYIDALLICPPLVVFHTSAFRSFIQQSFIMQPLPYRTLLSFVRLISDISCVRVKSK